MFVAQPAIVGAGRLGVRLARAFATAGVPVLLHDSSPAALSAATTALGSELAAVVTMIAAPADLAAADFVVEAITEDAERKGELLETLDALLAGRAVLATTTASLQISELARATGRPDRVIGFHVPGPGPGIDVVEVVECEDSDPDALQATLEVARSIGAVAITCAEMPGFAVHRILLAGVDEAWRAQEREGLEPGAVDAAVTAAGVLPVGPFALVDALGHDLVVGLAELLEATLDGEVRVPRALRRGGGARFKGDRPPAQPGALADRVRLRIAAEALRVVEEGVATSSDVDRALTGALPPLAPLRRADAEGLEELLAGLAAAAGQDGARFAPPVLLERLVAQGRLGSRAGQGVHASPPASPGPDLRAGIGVLWLDGDAAASARALDAAAAAGARAVVLASADPDGVRATAEQVDQIAATSLVTVAALQGHQTGIVLDLVLACDVCLAARSATFGRPTAAEDGAPSRLAARLGPAKARELQLTGALLSGTEAYELGLVTRVVDDHELFDHALMWARRATTTGART